MQYDENNFVDILAYLKNIQISYHHTFCLLTALKVFGIEPWNLRQTVRPYIKHVIRPRDTDHTLLKISWIHLITYISESTGAILFIFGRITSGNSECASGGHGHANSNICKLAHTSFFAYISVTRANSIHI